MSQVSGRNRKNNKNKESKKMNKDRNNKDIICLDKKSLNESCLLSINKSKNNNKNNLGISKTKEISVKVENMEYLDITKTFLKFDNVRIENPINGNEITLVTLLYVFKNDEKLEPNHKNKIEDKLKQSQKKKIDKEKSNSKQYCIESFLCKKRLLKTNYILKFEESKDENTIVITKVVENISENRISENNKINEIKNKKNKINRSDYKKTESRKNTKETKKNFSNKHNSKKNGIKTVQNNKIPNSFKKKEHQDFFSSPNQKINNTKNEILESPDIGQVNLINNPIPINQMENLFNRLHIDTINKREHVEHIEGPQNKKNVEIINVSGEEECFNLQDKKDYEFDNKNHLSIEVTEYDIITVKDQNLLNDTIITFYLKYLENVFCKDGQKNIYCFNTHFFVFLQNEFHDDITKDFLNYKRLGKWGKYINIFDYEYVAIPINENKHWSLIIIVNPGKLKQVYINVMNSIPDINNFTEVIYFDSFYPDNEACMKVIKRFLVMELHRRTENQVISNRSSELNSKLLEIESYIKGYFPRVPIQCNTYDCGIYLLTYAELFFNNPDFIKSQLDKIAQNSNIFIGWFEILYINKKRDFILKLIHDVAEKNNLENKKTFLIDHLRDNQHLLNEFYNFGKNKDQILSDNGELKKDNN